MYILQGLSDATMDAVFTVQKSVNRLAAKYGNPKVAVDGVLGGETTGAVVDLAKKFVAGPQYAPFYKTIVNSPTQATVAANIQNLATDLNALANTWGLPPDTTPVTLPKTREETVRTTTKSEAEAAQWAKEAADASKPKSSNKWIWWTVGIGAVAVAGVWYYKRQKRLSPAY